MKKKLLVVILLLSSMLLTGVMGSEFQEHSYRMQQREEIEFNIIAYMRGKCKRRAINYLFLEL